MVYSGASLNVIQTYLKSECVESTIQRRVSVKKSVELVNDPGFATRDHDLPYFGLYRVTQRHRLEGVAPDNFLLCHFLCLLFGPP